MGKFINRICFTLCFALFYLCSLRAEYSCDGGKCSDYKLGLSALAGVHSTALHSASIQGVGINVLFSQYNAYYGFIWNTNLSFIHTRLKNAQNDVLASNRAYFSALGAYIDTNVLLAKNLRVSMHNPVFLGMLIGLQSFVYDAKYDVPDFALLTLGLGLSGSYMLEHNLAFEYALSYSYGVYGLYAYPQTYYSPDRFAYNDNSARLKPNNHKLQAFIGLHKNKLYGLYSKLHFSLMYIDRSSSFKTHNAYPQSMQVMFGLECGFGFNQWL